jgi:O-antigen ligase
MTSATLSSERSGGARIGRFGVLSGTLVGAAAASAAVTSSPRLGAFALGLTLLILAPELTLLAVVALIEEELTAGGHTAASVAPPVRAGASLYQTNFLGFRLIVVVAVLAAVIAVARRRPRLSRPPIAVLAALSVWSCALALQQGAGFKHAVTGATPWVLLLSGYVVGACLREHSSLRIAATRLLATALALKAAIALFVWTTGATQSIGGVRIVYYDSLTPYLGGAALLAAATSRDRRSVRIALGLAGAFVLVTSLRRNVVLALIAGVLVLGSRRTSRRLVVRAVIACGITAAIVSAVAPSLGRDAVASIESGFETTAGGGSDSSTVGHLNDLSVGRAIVASSPLSGVGVYAQAQSGLVVSDGGNLYIHDEYLQTWARYGLPGIVGLLGILALFFGRAWRTFARPPDSVLVTLAAIMLLALPVSLVFFPQLSSLTRFDVVVGVFAGVLPLAGISPRAIEAEPLLPRSAPLDTLGRGLDRRRAVLETP